MRSNPAFGQICLIKRIFLLVLVGFANPIFSQQNYLPEGLRQHNTLLNNASLWNPTYSLDWNNPNSISLWSRWQWQSIDLDPTSLFLLYTNKFSNTSAASIGYLQNNSGVYSRQGVYLNYSQILLNKNAVQLSVGLNLFGAKEEMVDPSFPTLRPLTSNQLNGESSSNLLFSPGMRAQFNHLGVAISFENALQYNMTEDISTNQNMRINTNLSYDFRISGKKQHSFLRPILYFRTDPSYEDQLGGSLLYSNPKYWFQAGYNSFFGPSGGAGIHLFRRVSFGALVELSITDNLNNKDFTFEIQASYRFGDMNRPALLEEQEVEERIDQLSEAEIAAQDAARKAEEEVRRRRMIAEQDSIINVRLKEQRRLDSIARLIKVQIRPDEKYEEVATMQGLKPGYYLITNVFSTERYLRIFMQSLRKRGLHPNSFRRSLNGFNYVYLKRYDTLEEIREARDSKFHGKYRGPTWIFRVKD